METTRILVLETADNTVRPVRPRKPGSLARKEERLAWTIIAPVIVALVALGLYPALSTIWFSFQQGGSYGVNTTWAGMANYIHLFHDPQFSGALVFSLLFSLGTVLGQMIFGTALAVFANQKFPGRWLLRAAVIFPWAIPTRYNGACHPCCLRVRATTLPF